MKLTFAIFLAMITCLSSCGKETPNPVSVSDFERVIQMQPDCVILDIRTPEEFGEGHIPGAVNINFFDDDFVAQVEKAIPENKVIALYCKSGNRSAKATKTLEAKGRKIVELAGGITAWKEGGLPVTTEGEDIYFTSQGKEIDILPLIHASLRIRYDGKEIEIDPVGKMGDRVTDYASFPKADLILVTHEHYDHLDPEAIKTLSKPDTIVIANPNSVKILGYGVEMKNGDKKTIDQDIEIEAVPAYNISPERLQFHHKGRDNGYILTLGGMRIYIAGDTENIPEMKDLGKIDIAFLPCNLPYTMTPDQFIEAAKMINPKVVYPYHYGTTDLSSLTPALAPDGIFVRICPFDPGK